MTRFCVPTSKSRVNHIFTTKDTIFQLYLCDDQIDILADDYPGGNVVWHFDQTDIRVAKENSEIKPLLQEMFRLDYLKPNQQRMSGLIVTNWSRTSDPMATF